MFSYTPPLRDMQFAMSEVLGAPALLAAMPAFAEVDEPLMQQVLEEAGRFAAEVLFPLNAPGDRIGCRYDDGAVHTPPGFADAYRQFREAGWPALACAPEDGGQGLPHLLNCALFEMLSAANHGWTMYPGLLHGAYSCLRQHGTPELKARYLPKLVSGEWLATMALTEPQAGSDLGLLRSRALPQADGSVLLTGSKIFISGAEQDMSENIVHLVLARLPDAPPGSRGISLFLAPKFLPDGSRNAIRCSGIEHKMGIHGSATCALELDGATGWIIGEPNKGLNAMFVMMNAARLHVAGQGLGLAETAYQNALAYARERVQMKAPGGSGGPADRGPADLIVAHPAVQRLLMDQRAWVEGGRMLAYWTALLLDTAEHHPDPDARHEAHELLGLVTPVAKAMLTEQGFRGASQALQVFGGHGFICETGIEQTLRDARVTMIYEGTNEIQAIDLLLRKVLTDGGERLERLLALAEAEARAGHAETAGHAAALAELIGRLRGAVRAIGAAAAGEPRAPYRIAGEMLRLVGHCALAWLWLRAERTALARRGADPAFYDRKRATACYHFAFVLPETQQLLGVIEASLRPDDPAMRDASQFEP